jgi:hypothetical protein
VLGTTGIENVCRTCGKTGVIRGWKLEVRGGIFEEISDADFSQSY